VDQMNRPYIVGVSLWRYRICPVKGNEGFYFKSAAK